MSQEQSAANLTSGKSADGNKTHHNCDTQSKDSNAKKKMTKKQLEMEKQIKEQQQLLDDKKEKEDQERRAQEEIDQFKSQSVVKLDFMHAFGAYTGSSLTQHVGGQVQLIEDPYFDPHGESLNNGGDVNDSIAVSNNEGGKSRQKDDIYHKKLQLIYPVGRHIAIKQISTNHMRFVKTPKDVKNVTAMALNHHKTVLAVAARNNDIDGFQQMNLCIYVYVYGQSNLNFQSAKQQVKIHQSKLITEIRREKVLTIRPVQGQFFLAPVELSSKDLVRLPDGTYEDTVVVSQGSSKSFFYDRHITKIAINKNESFIAFILRNGPQQWYICVYDYSDRKPRKLLMELFEKEITSIGFMPRDSTKLLVTGDGLFALMGIGKYGSFDLAEFEGVPRTNPKFMHSCYRENDHLIGIADSGEVMVIEGLQVIQTIDVNTLTKGHNSNQIKQQKLSYQNFGNAAASTTPDKISLLLLTDCRFGFITSSKDTLFFFKQIEGTSKYACILKWRIEEFENTTITCLSVQENENPAKVKDSYLTIATKNSQIFFLNLYKQVYFPDSQQIQKEFTQDIIQNEDSDDQPKKGKKPEIPMPQLKVVGVKEDEDYNNSVAKIKEKEKKENEALIEKINYVTVGGGNHHGEVAAIDICISRPIIVSMSKIDVTVRIWNYHTGKCELTKSFIPEQERGQLLNGIALHPSGYYMAIAFSDKVKIYFIMDSEFKLYRELEVKNCHTIKFSNQGNYLACVDLKEISVFYSFSLEKPRRIQAPSQSVTNVCFNYNDTVISVVSRDGFIQKYDLIKFVKTGESIIDKKCNFKQCQFARYEVQEGQFKEKLYAVGQLDQSQVLLRCYNNRETNELDFELGKTGDFTRTFTGVVEVIPTKTENLTMAESVKKARNLILSTDTGMLMIYGVKPNLRPNREASVMLTHCGAINRIAVSHDNKTLFTAGQDGTIFVYKITEVSNSQIGKYSMKLGDKYDDLKKSYALRIEQNNFLKAGKTKDGVDGHNSSIDSHSQSVNQKSNMQTEKKEDDQKNKADDKSESDGSDMDPNETQRFRKINRDLYQDIDSKLSGIVLIEKQLMDEWRKQQEQLKLDLEKEENAFESKIRRERYTQDTEVAKMVKKKSEQLNSINKEYDDLQLKEAEEKDENTQAMKKMELNHLQCMEELQQLYEKKLQIQQKQYSNLLAMKENIQASYEQELNDLQRQNEEATEKLLQEYKLNFHEVQDLYDNAKRQADGLKMIYEERMNQTKFENNLYIKELKEVFQLEVKEKSDVILTIANDIESIKRQQHREDEERKKYERITELANNKRKTREKLIEEKDRQIIELEEEKKQIQNQLRQKESELFKYKFKIKELDKTKAVLTHRTQEMKASLEPKEQQIENLKEQLLNLEKGFQYQSKAIATLKSDVEKKKDKIKEMEHKVANEKAKTKQNEQTINNFVNDVHKAYKTKNDEEYIKGLMSIYNQYVRQHTDEILENKKKDPETIEELDRQLQYMEKSIAILKKTTMSNQAKTKSNINKRRQENNFLIGDLEAVRASKRHYQSELEKKTLTIQKLKLEKQKIQREFAKKLSGIEQETLQRVKAAGVLQQQKDSLDQQFEQDTLYQKGSKPEAEFFSNEPGVPSKVKGKIYKGTTFARGSKEDKSKINELQTQLEESNQQILMYKMEKKTLQENLIRILDERANELGLTEDERREELNKLNIIGLSSDQETEGVYNI